MFIKKQVEDTVLYDHENKILGFLIQFIFNVKGHEVVHT